jgi:hypothetical protein
MTEPMGSVSVMASKAAWVMAMRIMRFDDASQVSQRLRRDSMTPTTKLAHPTDGGG